jgi:hypothetical protein
MYPFNFNDTPPWFGVQDLASLRHAWLVLLWDFEYRWPSESQTTMDVES